MQAVQPNPAVGSHGGSGRVRDPRLDFFRGVGMFIIFIAHVPGNWWTLWIPARYGFSDATEMFVFCSGMASAIAFGRVFSDRGMVMGSARIAHRVWQVYWAHIALFFAVAMSMAALDASEILPQYNYINYLNLWPFFNNTPENLLGLMTLTYVPNYFDILPMYLVILAMIPLIIALARFGGIKAVAVFCISLWLVASFGVIDPPAEPWSDRPWFFNPFSWQLIFFTGFCFGLGLLKAPPIEPRLVILALVIVVISIPFAYYRVYNLEGYEFLKEIRGHIGYFYNKTHFGLFRYLHFLALAYLAYSLAGEGGRRLMYGGLYGKCVSVVRKVGQQSLAVFLTSMFIARLAGVMFDAFGKSELMMVLVNGTGFAILIATAYTVAWFKSQPWRKPAPVAKHKAQPEQTGPPSSPSLAEQRA